MEYWQRFFAAVTDGKRNGTGCEEATKQLSNRISEHKYLDFKRLFGIISALIELEKTLFYGVKRP